MSEKVLDRLSIKAGFTDKWLGDWGGKLLVGMLVFVSVYVVYVFFHWGGKEDQALISNIATALIYLGPSILALRTSRLLGKASRSGRAWLFIGLAQMRFYDRHAVMDIFRKRTWRAAVPVLGRCRIPLILPANARRPASAGRADAFC